MSFFGLITSLISDPLTASQEGEYQYTSNCVRTACMELISITYMPNFILSSKDSYIEVLVKLFTDKPLTLPEIDTLAILLHTRVSEKGFDRWIHEQIDKPTVLSDFLKSFPRPYDKEKIRDTILRTIRKKITESELFQNSLGNLSIQLPPNNNSKGGFSSKNFNITPFGIFLKNGGGSMLVYSPRVIIEGLSSAESEFKEKEKSIHGIDIYSLEFCYSNKLPITIIIDREGHHITGVDSTGTRYSIKTVLSDNKVMATKIANHQFGGSSSKSTAVHRTKEYIVTAINNGALTLQDSASSAPSSS